MRAEDHKIKDFPMPSKFFLLLGGIKRARWDDLLRENPHLLAQADKGIPVFAVVRVLYDKMILQEEKLKRLSTREKVDWEDDEILEDARLALELKHEKVMERRIINQIKLGYLIPKDEASTRVLNILLSVKNTILHGIKLFAARRENYREVERELTKDFNSAIDKLESESQVISWEADGSTEILRTRLESINQKVEALDLE